MGYGFGFVVLWFVVLYNISHERGGGPDLIFFGMNLLVWLK